MPKRDVPAYRPLKDYVRRRGGLRLGMHGDLRDRIVDEIVADWPTDCPVEHVEEVVRARIGVKVKKKYGSIVAMLLLSALVNVIVRLVMDWWLDKNSHRVLMRGWASAAQHPDL